MLGVLRDSWPLLLGMLLLMLGNGLQGTLLGVRGAMEGMTPGAIAAVMSAYSAGLLIGARVTPRMIRRVGHVRVFAALASVISAAFVLYPVFPDPFVWAALRAVVGFCFCGVYVTAESWLNDRATNETRGQAMSAYMVVTMGGIVAAQGLLLAADPGGYTLFVLISVLVSVAVAPMLLSVSPAPPFQATRRMSLGALFRASPLGCVSAFMLGGIYAALFNMVAVYGVARGFSVSQISALVGAIYLGGLLFQWPVGLISDRTDRRRLIVALCAAGAAMAGAASVGGFATVVGAAFLLGGAVNPLYSLTIAYTNDFLTTEEMPAAAGGLLFLNGLGAIGGPLAVGALMERFGAGAFFVYVAALLVAVGLYGLWRMTRRPAPSADATGPFAMISPSASPVAVEATQERQAEKKSVQPPAETSAAA
jgi:MFS family permease